MSQKIIRPEGMELVEYLNDGYVICHRLCIPLAEYRLHNSYVRLMSILPLRHLRTRIPFHLLPIRMMGRRKYHIRCGMDAQRI